MPQTNGIIRIMSVFLIFGKYTITTERNLQYFYTFINDYMDEVLQNVWKDLVKRIELSFGEGIEIEAIILLIGIQELGKGYFKPTKDEKLDLMHIATCKLLEPLGHYKYTGKDADGWPQWEAIGILPTLKPGEQKEMMKRAIIGYFKVNELA